MSQELITEIKSQLDGLKADWLKSGAQNDSIAKEISDLSGRITELEAQKNRPTEGEKASKSYGQRVVESDNFRHVQTKQMNSTGAINVGSFEQKAVTSSVSYIPAQHNGAFMVPFANTGVRGLMPNLNCSSGTFDYARGTFTNNANMQGAGTSPVTPENYAKAESDLSFTTVTGTCLTLAHLLPVSKQALDDMAQLSGIIDSQLLGGLRIKEEQQLLAGTGASGQMYGIIPQATAYDTDLSPSSPNSFDKLRMALYQVYGGSKRMPSAIVLNPIDWAKIQLLKASTAGTYLIANPAVDTTPQLWGFPVVQAFAVTAGTFLVGAFATAAAIYDRQDATIEVSNSHSDFFAKNMVAVRAEERLGLAVMFPNAFISGSL